MTAIKAIRLKCVDCSGGAYKEVELCPILDCPLWEYRFGMTLKRAKKEGRLIDKGQAREEWGLEKV